MSKQDRQGARTPAELERKHSKVLSGQDDNNANQNRQIEELSKSMSHNTGAFNYSIQQINARLTNVEASVKNLEGDESTSLLAERVTEAEQAIAEIQEGDTALAGRVSSAEAANIRQDLDIEELGERLTTVETTLASLEARVAALEG